MTDGIQRKSKGRGFVYRWRETMSDGTVKQRTSAEFPTRLAAQISKQQNAEALAQLKAHRGRTRGPLMLLVDIAERWAKSGRARIEPLSAGYCHEVVASIKRLAKVPGFTTTMQVTKLALDDWTIATQGKGVTRSLAYLKVILTYARDTLRQPVRPEALAYRRARTKAPLPPVLLTQEEVDGVLASAQAVAWRFGFLLRQLTVYGCRPIDMCRLDVGDYDHTNGTLQMRNTKNGETVIHPLLPEDCRGYDRLSDGRAATDPMHTNPRGKRWNLGKGGQSSELITWYRKHAALMLQPGRRGIYLLKDYAISSMETNGIDDRTKALFTGHRDLNSYKHYKATNMVQARAALAKMDGAQNGVTSGAQQPRSTEKKHQEMIPSESIRYGMRDY